MSLFLMLFMLLSGSIFAQAASLNVTKVAIPHGAKGIGFDDVNFSAGLHKVIVPAGHTGKLFLIDPVTNSMHSIGGFSSSPELHKGHRRGISSADAGDGFIFTADHGTNQLVAIDDNTGAKTASAALDGDVDFVRYVRPVHEVWATEPDNDKNKQIEVFRWEAGPRPVLARELSIPFSVGPESLTIDQVHQRAYTNVGPQTAVIDVMTHKVIDQWQNGCVKSRGTALDEEKGFLFVACREGQIKVFDLNKRGKLVSNIKVPPGVDLIDYNQNLSHLYVPSAQQGVLSVLGISSKGAVSLLGTGKAAQRSHCVTADDQNNVWVCDPHDGGLLKYQDRFLKST